MDLKKQFLKYLQYWPWFLVSLIIFMSAAFIFIKVVPSTYETSATIFIDKKQEDQNKIITISTDKKSNEDKLEDEIRLMTSNEFLLGVVKNLDLNFSYFEKVYTVQNNYVNAVPFVLIPTVSKDSLPQISYEIKIDDQGFTITDPDSERVYSVKGYDGKEAVYGLPLKLDYLPMQRKNHHTILRMNTK